MRRASALLVAALFAAACRGDAPGDPPRVILGRTPCARCGMAVSEMRFAGGWVASGGESVVFDDVGEMIAVLGENPAQASAAWVGDFDNGRWTKYASAAFVRVPGLGTPMGTGVVAFADHMAAESAARSRAGASLLPPTVRTP